MKETRSDSWKTKSSYSRSNTKTREGTHKWPEAKDAKIPLGIANPLPDRSLHKKEHRRVRSTNQQYLVKEAIRQNLVEKAIRLHSVKGTHDQKRKAKVMMQVSHKMMQVRHKDDIQQIFIMSSTEQSNHDTNLHHCCRSRQLTAHPSKRSCKETACDDTTATWAEQTVKDNIQILPWPLKQSSLSVKAHPAKAPSQAHSKIKHTLSQAWSVCTRRMGTLFKEWSQCQLQAHTLTGCGCMHPHYLQTQQDRDRHKISLEVKNKCSILLQHVLTQ